jgi:hypothetical protein
MVFLRSLIEVLRKTRSQKSLRAVTQINGSVVLVELFQSADCRPPPFVRFGSWLRENSEIEFANGNFVSTSINLKNKNAGDGCRDKTIEKIILRAFRARAFSRSLGHFRKSARATVRSALPR